MKNNQDPREFRDLSDNPTNTGWEDKDWDDIPHENFIDPNKCRDDKEDEESFWENYGERFD